MTAALGNPSKEEQNMDSDSFGSLLIYDGLEIDGFTKSGQINQIQALSMTVPGRGAGSLNGKVTFSNARTWHNWAPRRVSIRRPSDGATFWTSRAKELN
jgi:hypothetical protein